MKLQRMLHIEALHLMRLLWNQPVLPNLLGHYDCRSQGNFCRAGTCPPTFAVSGTCHGGLLKCCSK
uniref:Beta-defensin-like domain-containing protein n=1 Tax=Calidris pygmaea TaxID=425635 RepID=A0A8C3KHC7_9CHAR